MFYIEGSDGGYNGTHKALTETIIEGHTFIKVKGPFISSEIPFLTHSEVEQVNDILRSKRTIYEAPLPKGEKFSCAKAIYPQKKVIDQDICNRLNELLSGKYNISFVPDNSDNMDTSSYKDLSIEIQNQKDGYDSYNEIEAVTNEIVSFIKERDWEQFHKPKDTALALSIEASELNEVFLWKDEKDADVEKIKEELADVLIYSLDLARQYNLDVAEIIRAKIKRNSEKYPISKCSGVATKYTEL